MEESDSQEARNGEYRYLVDPEAETRVRRPHPREARDKERPEDLPRTPREGGHKERLEDRPSAPREGQEDPPARGPETWIPWIPGIQTI